MKTIITLTEKDPLGAMMLDGLNLFFQFIKTILAPDGKILADSTDLCGLSWIFM